MTKKSKSGKDIIEELLSEVSEETSKPTKDILLSDKFVLDQLKIKAASGDIRALELLGKHLKIFDKDSEKGNELIDIFAEEGSIEDNIFKFLDIMEDKYAEELAHALPTLLNKDEDLYMDEKERAQLLRQINTEHQKNLEKLEEASKEPSQRAPTIKEQLAEAAKPLDPFKPKDSSNPPANVFRI